MPGPDPKPDRKKPRLREKRLERDMLIWELRAKGQTLRQIASAVDLSKTRIHDILERIEDATLAKFSERIEHEKIRQEARLEYLYNQALKGWEGSQRPTRKTRVKAVKGERASTEKTMEETTSSGNPQFLAEARGALSDKRKVWGLDTYELDPAHVAETTPDEALAEARAAELASMTPSRRRAFRAFQLRQHEHEAARLRAELEGHDDERMEETLEDEAGADE